MYMIVADISSIALIYDFFFFSSRRRHTRCALVTGVQTCALPICYYEQHHNVRYTEDAIKAAVELSSKYINDRKLPDKSIDVIDEVGAAELLKPDSRRRKTIGVKEIEAIVAKIARITAKSVSREAKESLRNLDAELKRVVYGKYQDRKSTRLNSSH